MAARAGHFPDIAPVALYPSGNVRVWPQVAVELVDRVSCALTDHVETIVASLARGGLLVIGLSADQLREGFAAERGSWEQTADEALARYDDRATDQANSQAISDYADATLRAEQATILLTAVCENARDDHRGEAGRPPADDVLRPLASLV